MRNISFALTTAQVRRSFRTGSIEKDVTRRLGWRNAQPGEQLCACEKCQGLGKGGQLVRLGTIELVSVRLEPLIDMLADPAYGTVEVLREGFPEKTPAQFVEFFCQHNKVDPTALITRLEFRYLIKPVPRVPLTATEARACCACQHWQRREDGRGTCQHQAGSSGAHCTCTSFSPLTAPAP